MTYSSAGHPPPRFIHDQSVATLDLEGGLPLGIDPIVKYPEHHLILHPGDRLLFYTDGVSEAFNSAREQFGTDSMDAALLESTGDAQSLLKAVLAVLKQHDGDDAAGG